MTQLLRGGGIHTFYVVQFSVPGCMTQSSRGIVHFPRRKVYLSDMTTVYMYLAGALSFTGYKTRIDGSSGTPAVRR